MSKVITGAAAVIAAVVATTPPGAKANTAEGPPLATGAVAATAKTGDRVPVPAEAFARMINGMALELGSRWRVAGDFHDHGFEKGTPFGQVSPFGKVGGGGSFVKFTPAVKAHRMRAQVDTIFVQHKPA